MNNIKIGDVLEHKNKDNGINIKILEVLQNIICYKALNGQSNYWDTKDYIQENYIIPEVKWVPEIGDAYYVADITTTNTSTWEIWSDDEIDNYRLKYNLVFKTSEEKTARTEEILKLIN